MPSLVGGFGNQNLSVLPFENKRLFLKKNNFSTVNTHRSTEDDFVGSDRFADRSADRGKGNENITSSQLGPYLAGLIEGNGTFGIPEKSKPLTKKYAPKILIVFKEADLPLANYLQNITGSGNIYIKSDRGYVLWQIQDISGVFNIVNIINGHMRTPKIEALYRTITWLNEYFNNSKLRSAVSGYPISLISFYKFKPIHQKSLDISDITKNAWLAGFSDARANFTISINNRTNKNSTRIQLFYRLEIKQTYHKLNEEGEKFSFFPLMSKIATFLNTNLLSRTRIQKEKQYYSFIVMAHSKISLNLIINYFNQYPLLSSKYLDFQIWANIVKLQPSNPRAFSFLEVIEIRKNFHTPLPLNSKNWDHLKECYLLKNKK